MNTSPSPLLRAAFAFALLTLALQPLIAQVPQALNYQGRVAVSGQAFTGTGQFRFALVNGSGTVLWSSHASATTGVTVADGLYSVRLGDTSLTNMAAVPSSLFSNPDLRLRVWFNDGTNGLQQLAPDQRLAPVGYAHRAASVDSVPASAIAPDSLQPSRLAHSHQTGAADSLASIPAAGGTLNVTFPQPFETPPTVTLDGLPVTNVTATGFSVNIPPRRLVVDDGTPATNSVGVWRDVMLVQGNPAIAYTDDTTHDLKFVRATNPRGTAWGTPVVAAAGGGNNVGSYCSMALLAGDLPAIAYVDATNLDLKFVRALDVNGSAWATPVTVASHATDDLGRGCVLKNVVIGEGIIRPFIVYLDATAKTIKVAKANREDGTLWSPVSPVPALTGITDPLGFDLHPVANGLAVYYYDPADELLHAVETTSLITNAWGAPRFISLSAPNARGLDAFTTSAGTTSILWVEQGTAYTMPVQPSSWAIAYTVSTSAYPNHSRVVPGDYPVVIYPNYDGMRSITATNSNASAWAPPHVMEPPPVFNGVFNPDARPAGVRLADGTVLAVYYSNDGGGRLEVSGAQAPGSNTWQASLVSPLLATGVVPGSITRESLAPGFFGSNLRTLGVNAFATGEGAEALGLNSWASGYESLASGDTSVAMGYGAAATGSFAVAIGSSTKASGQNSLAMGGGAAASGRLAVALGYSATASGLAAIAMGDHTVAAGDSSTAMGYHTRAESFGETSLGMFPNANAGDSDNISSVDVLLEVGNGTGVAATSNALTILKSGRTGLGTADTSGELTHLLTLPNVATAAGGQGRANAWTTYSDSRIKTEQRPLTYGLREIMRLQPRAYTQHSGGVEHGKFICEDAKGGCEKTIGFIAQEVEKVIPEAVQKPADPDNQLYGMSYEKLIPVLVKASQELKTENDTLKAQLQQTNAVLQAMQQRLEKLESSQPRRK